MDHELPCFKKGYGIRYAGYPDRDLSNKGIKKIRGFYYPTAKNAMVKDFYGKMGFSQVACDAAGNSEWELEITLVWEKKNNVICVNGE